MARSTGFTLLTGFTAMAGLATVLLCVSCSRGAPPAANAAPQMTYDPKTGKLVLVTAELHKCGKIDTWTYMDGPTIMRTESDRDCDGKIDQWEFHGKDGHVHKVANSRQRNGRPDAWAYPDAKGQIVRIEVSSSGNEQQIDSWEFYDHGVLVRSEEDTNHDGKADKWETYQSGALTSVEFDENFDGIRDRRLIYSPPGMLAMMESEPDARGTYQKKVAMR